MDYLIDLLEVEKPKIEISFRERIIWTFIVLGLFFVMSNIMPIDFFQEEKIQLEDVQTLTLIVPSGFIPITSLALPSIVLTWIILLIAYGFLTLLGININFKEFKNKVYLRIVQYLLVFLISLFGAFILGLLFLSSSAPMLISVSIQIAICSILVMFMIEIVDKYGIGGGIWLFIIGSVLSQIFITFLNPLRLASEYAGIIPNFLDATFSGNFDILLLLPIFSTVIAFIFAIGFLFLVLFRVREDSERFEEGTIKHPLEKIHIVNVSLLFTSTLLRSLFFCVMLISFSIGMEIDTVNPNQLYYWISSPLTLGGLNGILISTGITKLLYPNTIIHLIFYIFTFSLLFAFFNFLFVKFWTETSFDKREKLTQVSSTIAERHKWQILRVGFSISFLVVFIDLIGAIGTGVGILLTVGTLYLFYERIKITYQKSNILAGVITLIGAFIIGILGFFIFLLFQIINQIINRLV
ncbi:MAG: hypothetical protein QXY62_00985 [Candidatus Altiarchaeota archaeon]